MMEARSIKVTGLVQGVGFRPFIHRLASRYRLKGWVNNRHDCVHIHAEGESRAIESFVYAIGHEAPQAAGIEDISHESTGIKNYSDFSIIKSQVEGDERSITEISPDIAVCDACLHDMKQQPHRIGYPFINCTNCGPRFSIIRDLPYDREKTTMDVFPMCSQCRMEYEDISDRRYHAQPVACNHCGPSYNYFDGSRHIEGHKDILSRAAEDIDKGKILAIKGMGGFHLVCDAMNEKAVGRLRAGKKRYGKPFAVMFHSLDVLEKYALLGEAEKQTLTSWRRPIVLLKDKKKLAPSVNAGFVTTGAVLPYMPFHYLLFEMLQTDCIVLTSGNISEEPVIINNETATTSLSKLTDGIITYNREIHNRNDDSVGMIVNNRFRISRRSRSYAPSPIRTRLDVNNIIATGAELVNCFCVGKGEQALLSQHIGDLKNSETLDFFEESMEKFKRLFRVHPELIACDLHPDYLSTRYAEKTGIAIERVQHHHAHIASCMAEHKLDEKVIGVAMDGTGLGTDGSIWGGEFMLADLVEFERLSHFEAIPVPGGDKATEHPWRMALAYLHYYYGDKASSMKLPFLDKQKQQEKDIIIRMLQNNINSPLSSSAGRLFDAVAALTNICTESDFHAEAPMRLEAAIREGVDDAYPFEAGKVLSFRPSFDAMIRDINKNTDAAIIASRFHNTIIKAIFAVVNDISKSQQVNKVVLSGGSFQNAYLLGRLENMLAGAGLEVFSHEKVPSNDGGIALGQLAIAAKRRSLSCV